MKTWNCILLSIAGVMLLGGCSTMTPQNKQLFGMQTGGMIGSVSGSLIGDRIGGWGGSLVGSVVGGVAGSALGAAATSPYTQQTRTDSYEERSVPTLYIRDIILDDENGNRAIDAGERCRFTFILCNEGNRTLKEIIPELKGKKQAKGIRCSDPVPIRNVKPGEIIRYRVNLIASPKLKSGEARYTIRLKTGNRQDTYEETFDVPTLGR